MACTGTPTLTQFTTLTSTGTTTTFSNSVSTPPDSVSTTVTQSCVASSPGASTTCVDVVVIITIPGVPSTAQIPVTLTNTLTQTLPTETLFASCGDGPDSTNPLVITRTVTSTSTTAPAPATSTTGSVQQDNSSAGNKMTPIISSAVGGSVGLICIVGLLWFLISRRRRKRPVDPYDRQGDMFSVRRSRDRHGRFDLNADVGPKPYDYGLVGYTTSPLPAEGPPPGSPPMSHSRQPSLPSNRTNFSRPSTNLPQRGPSGSEFVVKNTSTHHVQYSTSSSQLSQPVTAASWNPMAEFISSDGSPTSIHEPRRLQIVNAPLSPAVSLGSPEDQPEASSSVISSGTAKKGKRQDSRDVIVHTDGGRVDPDGTGADAANRPPAYDAKY